MLSKFINPFTDFGFKKLFGEEANKELLIDFLNQLLPEEDQIADLSYQANEHFPRTPEERKAIFDLYCENQDGEKFIIELQRAKQKYFKDRSLYYSTFPIQEQAEPGKEWKFRLKSVYTIGIMDFLFEEEDDEPEKILHRVQLMEVETCKVFYDKLTFIYLETPKFTKALNELKNHFDKWLYLLRNLEQLQSRPVELQERVFNRFFDLAELAKYSPIEKKAYEASLKNYRDLYNVMETAKEEAKEEGRLEGRIEGREEGREEGRTETLKNSVHGLLKTGLLTDEQIAEALNISVEQVREFKDEK
ncbi:Rpn family recombination-promoting nuclease/putative transposase [Persicobacter diffluens]|uniref:Rpn family recombination-promoting nuclease/putative transposase n=1 Tax=Persicobacter diffluens TaxID=981 RepID=A0AAN4VX91_9BACT|nr:hypothetical protein PEDI_11390 [Persicobacter diffluens]